MHLEVTFRNLQAREEIQRRAQVLFQKLQRFLDPAAEAQLVLSVDHGSVVSELVVTSLGHSIKAAEEDQELRPALDRVFHTMENTLRRQKERRVDRRTARGGEHEDGFTGGPPETSDDFGDYDEYEEAETEA